MLLCLLWGEPPLSSSWSLSSCSYPSNFIFQRVVILFLWMYVRFMLLLKTSRTFPSNKLEKNIITLWLIKPHTIVSSLFSLTLWFILLHFFYGLYVLLHSYWPPCSSLDNLIMCLPLGFVFIVPLSEILTPKISDGFSSYFLKFLFKYHFVS